MSSFFRNIRSSITRGRSSSRDSTPPIVSSSRRGSVTSLNRSETFIMNAEEEQQQQKPSRKSKVLSKFSTFTRRKKSTPTPEDVSYEHHPSDNATNTYYKWRTDGDRLLDYDERSDPFHFLYERPTVLKAMQERSSRAAPETTLNSATYRKSKKPTATPTSGPLREQMEQLKCKTGQALLEQPEPQPHVAVDDKYKTITLNSFRRSFRQKYLQQQQQREQEPESESASQHKAAWFVAVEKPPTPPAVTSSAKTKENRTDVLIFENDNYRPESRSPLRERPSRAKVRASIKRNQTFRVEEPRMLRPSSQSPTSTPAAHPTIRIEIKNSISPHLPGRFLPVGVAKPMTTTADFYTPRSSPQRRDYEGYQAARNASPPGRNTGRYQTLVQIGNNEAPPPAPYISRGRTATRVQLNGHVQPTRLEPKRSYPTTTPPSSGYDNVVLLKAAAAQSAKSTPRPALTTTATSKYATYLAEQRDQLRSNHKPFPKPSASTRAQTRTSNGGGGGGSTSIYLGRRDQQHGQATTTVNMQRRNRSPIKMPWR